MPCPLRVGMLGGWDQKPLNPTRLTPNEQYSHISLWCLWAAPIIIGAPLDKLDAFTLSLLTNDEVIEIDQDPLGLQAHQIQVKQGEVLVKEMEDGSNAVGLFNPGSKEPVKVEVSWAELGISGKQLVRDLWRQKDLGVFSRKFSTTVPSHGVVLVRIWSKVK
jgi:alpha-galactosidase